MSNENSIPNYHLFVISAPSGGGKNTIIRKIIRRRPQIKYSISATTRPIREGEKNGEHFFFVTDEEFQDMINNDRLIEYELVHGHYYGTQKGSIEDLQRTGGCMLFDLDVKGGLHLKRLFPRTTLIFLLPPSMETLKQRLIKRRRESLDLIEIRLQNAREEMKAAQQYDYRVMNDELDKAVSEVLIIIDENS